MKVINYRQVPQVEVKVEGARGAKIRPLLTDADGAPNFAMRHFELEPDGRTPFHQHSWEHEVFVCAGLGFLVGSEGERPLNVGDCVLVEPNAMHAFRAGEAGLEFLCVIPIEKPCGEA